MELGDVEAIRRYLLSFDLWPAEAREEGELYVQHSLRRLLATIDLVPRATAPVRLLELGANPYFTTLPLARFRPEYRRELANWFGPQAGGGEQTQEIASAAFGERHCFRYAHFNAETDLFPYADASFDLVLCCEILEHLVCDPSAMLVEIHRVLAPGGALLLTTPNVLRLENVLRLAAGRNIGDAYSGYGPYGRHNREFTPAELADLVRGSGFSVTRMQLGDLAPRRLVTRPLRRLVARFRDHIYLLAHATGPRYRYRPAWLYRGFR